jgi:DNA-binding transcriptional LysR family regulator
MDFHKLQVFIKVYEHRSFSRAAENILLSQPTVSGHIKYLEEELGATLFDRMGREIMPTSAAELLYGHAKDIMERVDEATAAMDTFSSRFRGELKLGGSTIPGQYVLPGLMGRFKKEYPEVRLNLHIAGTRTITAQVLEGVFELGVVGAASDEERLEFEPLIGDSVCLIAPLEHPLAGKTVQPAKLAGHPMVVRENGSGTLSFVLQALKKAGLPGEKLQITAQLGSNMAVLQGVQAGLGLGFISQKVAGEGLDAGRVAEVRIKGLKLQRPFYLIRRKERTHSPAAQMFIKHCREQLGNGRKNA